MTQLGTLDAIQQTISAEVGPDSGYKIARDEIEKLTRGQLAWPASAQERVSRFHALYLEPVNESYEPFWGLPPRFYYKFELGWPTSPTVWFHYQLTKRSDGHIGGDMTFPSAANLVVGASMAGRPLVQTYVPGELMVGFKSTVTEAQAKAAILRVIPGSTIRNSIWSIHALVASCPPFDEPAQITALEAEPEVRYAEVNAHTQLIVPGGKWLIREL